MTQTFGFLAEQYSDKQLPLRVLKSNAAYYIGTADDEGPFSRESVEYFRTQAKASKRLKTVPGRKKPRRETPGNGLK